MQPEPGARASDGSTTGRLAWVASFGALGREIVARSAFPVATEKAVFRSRVSVEVVRDIAHVAVHPELADLRRGYLAQTLAHVRDVRLRGSRAVEAPHHHRRLADLALGDPADVVLEEPGRQFQGAAQVAVLDADELGIGGGGFAHGPIPYRNLGSARPSFAKPQRPSDGAARRIMQVLTACATSLSPLTRTSHSMRPSVRPAFFTLARAEMRPVRTVLRKFTFISTVV